MKYNIEIDPNALRARSRMFKRYGAALARNGPMFSSTVGSPERDEEPRLCLEGLAILFDTPILNKYGETIIFEPKAFDKYFGSGARPPFWQSHDATTVFGYNTELRILDEGVAFRLPLVNSANAAKITELVMSGKQASISIGFTETKTRNDTIFGHAVKFIEEADIREVSLVPVGACKKAFCRVIDANHEPPLHESVNSVMFGIEYDLHNVKVLKRDNDSAIEWLKERLSTLEAGSLQHEQPVMESMTNDQLNRLKTAEYDQLRASALQRLRRC